MLKYGNYFLGIKKNINAWPYWTYHQDKKNKKYENEKVHWSKNWVRRSYSREIKISQNHPKLCEDTFCDCAVIFIVGAKHQESELTERYKHQHKHDSKRCKLW